MTMKYIRPIRFGLALAASLFSPAGPIGATERKPLIAVGAQIKQLPAGDTLKTNASTTGAAPINIPHGTAPTSPNDGDCWTTSSGAFCRVNGATKQLDGYAPGGTDVAVADGGTGVSTVPANGELLIGNGSGYTVASLTAGANVTITPSAGGITIASSISGGTVGDGDYGDITVSSSGTVYTIDNNVVSYAKMQDVSAASKLLGRGSAAGSGDPQEITLGTGLSMSGTTLNASAAPVNAIASATVATSQTNTSTSYADLATVGPAVTLTTGTEVIVTLSCNAFRASGTGSTSFCGVAVSGATTLAASDANAAYMTVTTANTNQQIARRFKITGLTAGSNTFTMKYKNESGTHTYLNRDITVEALN